MNLEELKKKKLEQLKQQIEEQQSKELEEHLKLQQQIEILENIARQYLTKEAIERYGNLKIAYPEKAIQVITLIANLAQNNQITQKITDLQLKELLKQLSQKKKEFKIKRI